MEYAVEINVSQAKKAGATSNLYIVQGRDVVFYSSSRDSPGAIKCEITTREGSSKNRVGYLEVIGEPISVDGFDPRPNHMHQWVKRDDRWVRKS